MKRIFTAFSMAAMLGCAHAEKKEAQAEAAATAALQKQVQAQQTQINDLKSQIGTQQTSAEQMRNQRAEKSDRDAANTGDRSADPGQWCSRAEACARLCAARCCARCCARVSARCAARCRDAEVNGRRLASPDGTARVRTARSARVTACSIPGHCQFPAIMVPTKARCRRDRPRSARDRCRRRSRRTAPASPLRPRHDPRPVRGPRGTVTRFEARGAAPVGADERDVTASIG